MVRVAHAGTASVIGDYHAQNPLRIPDGFALVCKQQGWHSDAMWKQLTDLKRPWFEAESGAYVYWNRGDGSWWIDNPSGGGVYIVQSSSDMPPANGWKLLPGALEPLPKVELVEHDLS
eukprot:scaffold55165_cov35-Tisochrysis_lutea.AAC.1